MFVFATVKSDQSKYDAYAGLGLARVLEPDSVVYEKVGVSSIADAYNEILDTVSNKHPDCEAVVLLHQDLELRDDGFCERIRKRLSDSTIGVIGAIGAVGVRSIAYWRADMRGRVREEQRLIDHGGGFHRVDAVDGMLLILSPHAARELRFDRAVAPHFHGYDIDLCFAARAAGYTVMVDDIDLIHHTKGDYGDRRAYLRASRAWRRKWMPGQPLSTQVQSLLDEFAVASRRDQLRLRARIVHLRAAFLRRPSVG
jgi:hypothetical protein